MEMPALRIDMFVVIVLAVYCCEAQWQSAGAVPNYPHIPSEGFCNSYLFPPPGGAGQQQVVKRQPQPPANAPRRMVRQVPNQGRFNSAQPSLSAILGVPNLTPAQRQMYDLDPINPLDFDAPDYRPGLPLPPPQNTLNQRAPSAVDQYNNQYFAQAMTCLCDGFGDCENAALLRGRRYGRSDLCVPPNVCCCRFG